MSEGPARILTAHEAGFGGLMKFALLFLIMSSALAADNSRILVVSGTPEEKIYEAALKKLDAAKSQLDERDVVVKTETAPSFGIRLIGKDGGEKWKGKADFEVKEITREIDQMPLRLDEIKKQRVIGR